MKAPLLLSPADEALLIHLATYRFLTIAQAVRLGVGNRIHVGERLKRFLNAGMVGRLPNSPLAGPAVHWLTERGRDTAAEYLPEGAAIQFLKQAYKGGAHAIQRIAIVDCHIALRQWADRANFSVDWFKAEFEQNPLTFATATRLAWEGRNYTPDALGQVTGPDGTPWLFAIEMETGGKINSVDNYRAKLPERLRVMENFEVEKSLAWPQHRKSLRLLFVFANDVMMQKAKRILPRPDADAWESIFFKSLDATISDFEKGWFQVRNEQAGSLFAA